MAVAGLVIGIISLIFSFIPGLNLISAILGILGIIFSTLGKKNLESQGKPSGIAVAGLVLSIISTVLGLLFFVACGALIGGGASGLLKGLF